MAALLLFVAIITTTANPRCGLNISFLSVEENKQIGSMDFLETIEISFDLQINSVDICSQTSWCHILHIDNRLPLIMLTTKATQFTSEFCLIPGNHSSRVKDIITDFVPQMIDGEYHHFDLKYTPTERIIAFDGVTYLYVNSNNDISSVNTRIIWAVSVHANQDVVDGNIKNLCIGTRWITSNPTSQPTQYPTSQPTQYPTQSTQYPTKIPTISPTKTPTSDPTLPTINPTSSPSTNPPTVHPTYVPTINVISTSITNANTGFLSDKLPHTSDNTMDVIPYTLIAVSVVSFFGICVSLSYFVWFWRNSKRNKTEQTHINNDQAPNIPQPIMHERAQSVSNLNDNRVELQESNVNDTVPKEEESEDSEDSELLYGSPQKESDTMKTVGENNKTNGNISDVNAQSVMKEGERVSITIEGQTDGTIKRVINTELVLKGSAKLTRRDK